MSEAAALWSPHLHPGERILWSADASAEMRRADVARQRMIYGAAGAASLVIALLLGVRFVESVLIISAAPSLLAAVTPLYLVFALAMGALALWGFRRMRAEPPAAMHFAATDSRLIALDAAGAVVDQMPRAEIDTVIAGGRRKTPDIYVLRKHDPKEERVFAIEHIDRPFEAKAIIEETYIPQQAEEVEPAP